jgi:cyclase
MERSAKVSRRIIPRLDIKGPNLVKGIHLEGLRVLGDPQSFARYYYDNGADELVYMDVVASLYNRNSLHDIISRTAKDIFIPLAVGGGLRSIDDMRAVLRSGADKIVINTAAVKDPEIIRKAANSFGSSTVVVSIEAKKIGEDIYEAYIDNGREKTGIEVFAWAQRVAELGAGEIMVTSIDQEGTGKGFDLVLVEKISRKVSIPVIACGGAGSKEDVRRVLSEAGADAVCIASMFHYHFLKENKAGLGKDNGSPFSIGEFSRVQDITIGELKEYLSLSEIECRI